MTDVVTVFSQTFDAGRTLPIIVPLVVTVLVLGLLMMRPLFAVMVPAPSGGRGVVRKPAGVLVTVGMLGLPLVVALSLGGYAWAALSGGIGRRLSLDTS